MGARKPFDKALFAANDKLARDTISQHLTKQGLFVTPNPNRYGVDLYVQSYPGEPRDTRFAVECEIKRVWESGPELIVKGKPCDTVQLPERKRKYLDSAGCPVQYWILNGTLTHAIVIPGELLLTHTPVMVHNKYVRTGELFYQIPVIECNLVEIGK